LAISSMKYIFYKDGQVRSQFCKPVAGTALVAVSGNEVRLLCVYGLSIPLKYIILYTCCLRYLKYACGKWYPDPLIYVQNGWKELM
jgi:hypothetical protein